MTVDKEIVFEFLLLPSEEITQEHINEVHKISEIVLNKYHPEAYSEYEELKIQILTKVLENRVNYDPRQDAYNYVFTIARNESGNLLKKLRREVLTDEFWSNPDYDQEEDESGEEDYESPIIKKYAPYLTGSKTDWDFVRLRQDEVPEILVFLHKFKEKPIPDYLKRDNLSETLYYLLNKLIME